MVLGATVVGMGANRADIGEAQSLLEPVAVAHGLAEQLVRVQKENRRGRVDPGDMVQQHRGFRGERRDDGNLSRERLNREPEQPLRIQVFATRLQDGVSLPPDSARLYRMTERNNGHSQPFDLTSARVRSDTPPRSIPAARQSDRERAISSVRWLHSGPK